MRDLRFRAWDKDAKEMFPVVTIQFNAFYGVFAFPYCLDNVKPKDRDIGYNVELMQNTGLKDSKGVELYEGDIVKPDDDSLGNKRFVCDWDNLDKFGDWVDNLLGDGSYPKMIITGNIYENPELLKEEKIE